MGEILREGVGVGLRFLKCVVRKLMNTCAFVMVFFKGGLIKSVINKKGENALKWGVCNLFYEFRRVWWCLCRGGVRVLEEYKSLIFDLGDRFNRI